MAINSLIRYIMLLFVVSYNLLANAQTTSYFSLIKIDEYGKIDSKCSGGQFVKVSKNICFDTDSEGNDIGNGKLYRDIKNHSKDHIYIGDSFHGKVRYIFSADYSTLIVEINPHFKFYYLKSAVPKGVITSSLIKHRNGGNLSVPNNSNYETIGNQSQGNFGSSSSNNTRSNSHNSNTNNQPTHKFKCAYCNGTGRLEKNDNAPATYGNQRPRQQCHECGKWYDPNVTTHYHQQCRHCGGTGYTR